MGIVCVLTQMRTEDLFAHGPHYTQRAQIPGTERRIGAKLPHSMFLIQCDKTNHFIICHLIQSQTESDLKSTMVIRSKTWRCFTKYETKI